MKKTAQIKKWEGAFGWAYTKRNPYLMKDVEKLYKSRYGIARKAMNEEFISGLGRTIRILEVGSNVGAQLLILQKMGFTNLYGIDIQEKAIELSKSILKRTYIIEGSALDIPFKDNYFDMVYTSGVLIHISPKDINRALREIHRCSRKYIWGFEYFADDYTEIEYRGNKKLLWKTDFAQLYLETFKDLALVKEKKFNYLENNNADQMFLLKKEKQ